MSVDKMKGLHKRPTYNELIEEIQLDEKIKLPNRQAKFLRESPYLSFLDGESYTDMMGQQQQADKHIQVEHAIREQAGSSSSASASELRGINEATGRRDQVENMLSPVNVDDDSGKTKLRPVNFIPDDSGETKLRPVNFIPDDPGKKQGASGAVGVGGTWDPDEGWRPQPDPLTEWYMAPTAKAMSSQPHLPDDFGLPARVPTELKRHESSVSNISSIISNHLGDVPHGNLIHTLMRGTGRSDPFEQTSGKKSRGRSVEDEYEDLMKDVAPNARLEKEYEDLMKDVGGSVPKSGKPNIFSSNPSQANVKPSSTTAASQVKPNPKFVKPKPVPPPPPTTNPGFVGHGTKLDQNTNKTYWKNKGMGYLKDQLELRGYKLPNSKLKGKAALNKGDLLKMIYKHDKIN